MKEAKIRYEAYSVYFLLVDGVFSTLHKTPEDFPNEVEFQRELASLKTRVKQTVKAWRDLGMSLTLKPYALEDHGAPHYERWRELGDLVEEFVESFHQQGLRENVRLRSMRDRRQRRFCQLARWRHLARVTGAREKRVEIKDERKRKVQPATELRATTNKRRRIQSRELFVPKNVLQMRRS
jgi:hypothetical protein